MKPLFSYRATSQLLVAGLVVVPFALAAQTASAVSNYAFAVRGIRVTVTAGSGTAALTLVQSGVASN